MVRPSSVWSRFRNWREAELLWEAEIMLEITIRRMVMKSINRQAGQSAKFSASTVIVAVILILLGTLPLAAQTFTLLHSFSGADGSYPYAGLVQATGGKLFGTTSYGGAYSGGTVFKVSTGGTLTTLYSFCALASCADGTDPRGSVVQARNGSFYG